MRAIDHLLARYGESHQHPTNKLIHWFCVPLIFFSLYGLLRTVTLSDTYPHYINIGNIILVLALLYYMRLSVPMFVGFVVWAVLIHNVAQRMIDAMGSTYFIYSMLFIFVAAWVVQFIGHKIEGKKPSFLEDIQFLLIGPAWLLHFILKKMKIQY